ncbi:MAG: hypothetical protein ACRENE_28470 [Polyangiaceae bacterium]
MRPSHGFLLACAGAVAPSLATATAHAAPQVSAGLTFGGVVEDYTASTPHGQAHLGGRADVLFLRDRGSDMALGPYGDWATSSFHDLDVGGGLSWLLPVRDDLPFVLSAGGFVRNGEGRSWAPGVEATIFWGSRSYNFHSWYGMAAGLFAQTRYLPGPTEQADLVLGVQVDAEMFLLPSLLIMQMFRSDTR